MHTDVSGDQHGPSRLQQVVASNGQSPHTTTGTGEEPSYSTPRLNTANLEALPEEVLRPTYDRSQLKSGHVHLGAGGFFKSLIAPASDSFMRKGIDGWEDWGIVAVNFRNPNNELRDQDGLYTLIERHASGDRLRVIGSITEILQGVNEREQVLDRMASPDCKIVTMTITPAEYGYGDDGEIDTNDHHAAVYIARALDLRREKGIPPFTCISCDNKPPSGDHAREMVLRVAERIDGERMEDLAERVGAAKLIVRQSLEVLREHSFPEHDGAIAGILERTERGLSAGKSRLAERAVVEFFTEASQQATRLALNAGEGSPLAQAAVELGQSLESCIPYSRQLADLEEGGGLQKWIAQHGKFPNTIVDRITPSTRGEENPFSHIPREHLYEDKAPVATEPYRQWLISRYGYDNSNQFPNGIPPWVEAGEAKLCANVAAYADLKARMVNSTHVGVGWLGLWAGETGVRETVQRFEGFFQHLLEKEIKPHFEDRRDELRQVSIDKYPKAVIERLLNPQIPDQVQRLTNSGSKKIPERILQLVTSSFNREGNGNGHSPAPPFDGLCLITAAWMRCRTSHPVQTPDGQIAENRNGSGKAINLVEDARMLEEFDRIFSFDDFFSEENPRTRAIFGDRLIDNEYFMSRLRSYYNQLGNNSLDEVIRNNFDLQYLRRPPEQLH